MPFYEREERILSALLEKESMSIRELSAQLYVSQPTLRRDLIKLEQMGKIVRTHGGAQLLTKPADQKIPFYLRQQEQNDAKSWMAAQAIEFIRDGDIIMLDGSTSAYHLVPFLAQYRDLIVITSGAKTAVALAEANIRTFCTGGQMLIHSFSYVGEQAENCIRSFNADIAFFSCHGLTHEGFMTDPAVEEANLRKVMFQYAKKKILLCDSSKFGKTCFYNVGHVRQIDGVISEKELPEGIAAMLKTEK